MELNLRPANENKNSSEVVTSVVPATIFPMSELVYENDKEVLDIRISMQEYFLGEILCTWFVSDQCIYIWFHGS